MLAPGRVFKSVCSGDSSGMSGMLSTRRAGEVALKRNLWCAWCGVVSCDLVCVSFM